MLRAFRMQAWGRVLASEKGWKVWRLGSHEAQMRGRRHAVFGHQDFSGI